MLCQEALLRLGGSTFLGRASHTQSLMQPGEEEARSSVPVAYAPPGHYSKGNSVCQEVLGSSPGVGDGRRESLYMLASFLTCQQFIAIAKPMMKGRGYAHAR